MRIFDVLDVFLDQSAKANETIQEHPKNCCRCAVVSNRYYKFRVIWAQHPLFSSTFEMMDKGH